MHVGVFPRTKSIIKKLKSMVRVVNGLTVPAKGINLEADQVLDNIDKIKSRLSIILEKERKRFNDRSISFVHLRQRYELEISEDLVRGSKRPADYAITSKRAGFLRFHTPDIENCLLEMNEAEINLRRVLIDFIVDYFKLFYNYNLVWRQVIICLSELDCLGGLAMLAIGMKIKCRPNILNKTTNTEVENDFELEEMVHPSLAAQMENIQEVSKRQKNEIDNISNLASDDTSKALQKFAYKANNRNKRATNRNIMNYSKDKNFKTTLQGQPISSTFSIDLESQDEDKEQTFVRNNVIKEEDLDIFLITGPNMGGKSTLLRQTALAVIMAQMGSFIPAKRFRFHMIDRIFTRIGAEDKILEGRSTFFIEMEETWNIVKEATSSSLLLIDELGRGTSTYDGVSLAFGVLKYIAEKIRSITLFATHYHILLEEFRLYKNIGRYYMASEYNERLDEVKFLYKFIKGQAKKSHSFIVAKMAGLPLEVLENAKEKAKSITQEKKRIEDSKLLSRNFSKAILALSKISKNQDVQMVLDDLNCIYI